MGSSDGMAKIITPKQEKRDKALIEDYQRVDGGGNYEMGAAEIMRKYEISHGTFYAILKKHGVKTRTK